MLTFGSGLISSKKYSEMIKDEVFLRAEKFSDAFLSENRKIFTKYGWARDPFHQWSRQWEYPFVYDCIGKNFGQKNGKLSILDLGSGMTFFPYFLAQRYPNSEMFCLDVDSSLSELFSLVEDKNSSRVIFKIGDMRKLPFPDNSLDCVYCISVLEHTKNYDVSLSEIKRVLRPGGVFVLTFDVSVDGDADISKEESKELLETAKELFGNGAPDGYFTELIFGADTLTTEYFKRSEPNLLPWKTSVRTILAFFKQLLSLKKPRPSFRNLAVWYGSFVKK